MKLFLLFISVFMAISFSGRAQQKENTSHTYFNNFDDLTKNSSWINSHTIMLSGDSSRKYVSRIDDKNPYSAGLETDIPEDLKRKNFRIDVSCDVFVKSGSSNKLVISVSKNDSSIFWEGVLIGDNQVQTNSSGTGEDQNSGKWFTVKKSTLIPGNVPAGSRVKVFVWNADGKSVTDVDELSVVLTEVSFPSFLPQ